MTIPDAEKQLAADKNGEAQSSKSSEKGDEIVPVNAGNASETSESKNEKKDDAGIKGYFRVFTYADTYGWFLYIVAFTCFIASGTALPLMDLIFGKFVTTFNNFVIGTVEPPEFRREVVNLTLWLVYLFIARFVILYIGSMAISVSAIRTTKALRVHFLQQVMRQDIAYFDSSENGSVAIQTTTNGNHVNNGISEKLGLLIQGMSTFIAAFGVAFAVQWKLTLITIAIVPMILIVTGVCVVIDVENENQIMAIYSKAGQLAEDILGSITTVHAFWAHPRLADKYRERLLEAKKVGMKKSPVYGVLFSTEYFCVYAGYSLAFWQGIRRYASGEIKAPGDVVTVIFAVIVAATAMTQIAMQILIVTKGASAANELFKVIDRKSEIDSISEEGTRPSTCEGRIELQNIRFAYPARPDVEVLKGFSLQVPANKTTALVGASGSGKSTIVGLLERWYNPASGSILLDGAEIKDLNLQWLRRQMRMVQQEPTLFAGTIFQNVCYGLSGTEHMSKSDDEKMAMVQEACKAANAHEFIEHLGHGYHTDIARQKLSGGQKQRIAIARSIISGPKILLLDEATSALDPKAERIVQEALDNVSHNRTTVVIAHKLSTIRKAHNIVVMSQGSIIEQGTHESLIESRGAYWTLVQAQDLGQGKSDKPQDVGAQIEGDQQLERSETVLTQTQTRPEEAEDPAQSMHYSLLKCLGIFMKERRELWPHFFIIIVICILGGLTYPALAIVFSRTMDAFQTTEPKKMIERGDFFALMFFVIALSNFIFYFILGWTTNIVSQHTTLIYREGLFKDMLRQDMSFFSEPSNELGALVSKLSTKPTNLQELLGFNCALILISVVNLVSSCILAIAYGWKLGLVVVFGGLPAIVISGWIRVRIDMKSDLDTSKRFADSAALAGEAVSAIRTVSSNTMEKLIMNEYVERLSGIEKKSIKTLLWTNFFFSFTQSVLFLSLALGFWYGGQLMSTGEYNTTQFFVVFTAIVFSGEAAAAFFSYTTSFNQGHSAANYILWLRQTKPTIGENDDGRGPDDSADPSSDKSTKAEIKVDDVYFAYPSRPGAKILKGVWASIDPGSTVAFVGASGCGKTTLMSLLERFYDPTSGQIRFNGESISTFCPRKYRSHISLVQQEPTLYDDSIRQNIALGLEREATDEDIERACRQANIWEFIISLPEGVQTPCGLKGTQLSGGQRQRIAIARALIRQPKLLLLDEATSALDTTSEKIVQKALKNASEGRTTVAVAHRLSTIKDSDAIMVFERGNIVEQGKHDELLALKGIYWQMCLGQGLDQEASK